MVGRIKDDVEIEMSAQIVKRRTYPKACEVEVGVQLEDIGWGWELAAREGVVGDFTTARETSVAKDVAFGAVDADVLVSISRVSVPTRKPKWLPYTGTLASYITGGYILPSTIMSRASLISTGVGDAVADGSRCAK